MLLLLAILACKSHHSGETDDSLPPGCDMTDPGGQTCSSPDECQIMCICTGGSQIAASSCEGQCGSADALCPTYCGGVGWDGLFCLDPQ